MSRRNENKNPYLSKTGPISFEAIFLKLKRIQMKKRKLLFMMGMALAMGGNLHAQVGVGTTSPNASAQLDVTSTTKGMLTPRMTTAQRDAISSPATGLIIYNTDNSRLEINTGTPAAKVWGAVTPAAITASNGLTLTGSNLTLGGTLTGGTTVNLNNNDIWFNTGTAYFQSQTESAAKANKDSTVSIWVTSPSDVRTYGAVGDLYGRIAFSGYGRGFLSSYVDAMATSGYNDFGPVLRLYGNAGVRVVNLAGTGTRMVTADVNGTLGSQTIPSYAASTSILLNGTSFERAALTGDVTSAQNSNATTIAASAVTTAKIADGNVTTAKIADGNVNAAKLTAGAGAAGRVATADASGNVSYTVPATVSTIYNSNGTLTSGRTVNLNNNDIWFNTGTAYFQSQTESAAKANTDSTVSIWVTSPSDVRTYGSPGDLYGRIAFSGYGRGFLSSYVDAMATSNYNDYGPVLRLFGTAGVRVVNLAGTGSRYVYADANGTLSATAATPSDGRLKTNIRPLNSALSKVMRLNPVSYDWKDTKMMGNHKQLGFVAQELGAVVPEVVYTEQGEHFGEKDLRTVKYEQLTALLTKAIQEQQQQIDLLNKRIEQLERRIK
jgi:hypothetical protein